MKGLLKFVTCGSVDDGKSTLIGHMLYDAKLLFADQRQALELESRIGGRSGALDYSLLLDGLLAEREQRITIDVAYRYFSTTRRSFIVADAPGHEEYTRNMAVGASFADLALLLVDATRGIALQTRRHARICALMGIRHVVFAVNKMDLVRYEQKRYAEIVRELRQMTAEFEFLQADALPVSAAKGDNVTGRSERMPWYRGKALLPYLEEVEIAPAAQGEGFCLPVQRVCRPHAAYRGFQGQIESGAIFVGERIRSLPSGEEARVKEILRAGVAAERAAMGDAVALQLDREVDVSRGCVLERGSALQVGQLLTAQLLWLDDAPLAVGRSYLFKLATKLVPASVMRLKYREDAHSGKHIAVQDVYKNEIVCCEIVLAEPVVLAPFASQRALGSFLLIDRVSDATAACGTISYVLRRSENVRAQALDITRAVRSGQKGQRAATLWFTGLSGAGKSTLANALEKRLVAQGRHTMLLDGDNLRLGLNRDLGFGEADRLENIRRVAEVARLMNDAGLVVLTAFISPSARDRAEAKRIIGADAFVEIYVATPLAVCESRDVKGLYKKAREGKIPNFTGVKSPYEAPRSPDITVDASRDSLEACADALLNAVDKYLRREERR